MQKAADEFAASKDLKTARLQFKAVSDALITLVKPEAGK